MTPVSPDFTIVYICHCKIISRIDVDLREDGHAAATLKMGNVWLHDTGKDWGQEENWVTEDETVGQHHQLSGHGNYGRQ